MDASTGSGSLAGVRVIEFCQIAAGPFCGMLLGDQGADVIKVESPAGDPMRQWPPLSSGYSENFAALNRNKRSIVLDLKRKEQLEVAKSLCLGADVVVENFRPGVMKRLGLGYETLSAHAPQLVYCSISAYGQTGPRALEGGFDVTLQAASGVMSVTGEEGGEPVKCGVPLTDFAAGLYAGFAISSALYAVRAGGPGRRIDVPMLGTSLAIAALQVSELFGSGRDPVKLGSRHPRNAPYQAFRSRDGHFVMAAGTDDLYWKACTCFGLDDIAHDSRYRTTADRARNQAEMLRIIEEKSVADSSAAWLARLREAGVPCAPINTYSEALADPQVEHYGWVQPLRLPNGVSTRAFTDPLARSMPPRRPPPALGEHTEEILAEVNDGEPVAIPEVRPGDDGAGGKGPRA